MKYYYKKKKRLLNVFCLTFICYFLCFYDTLHSLFILNYDSQNKPLLSNVILDYPRSMSYLTNLILIGSILYIFFAYFLESKNTKFIYLENINNSSIYKYYLLSGLSILLKIHISIYGLLSIILCFFYKIDFTSITYFFYYIVALAIYFVFLYNIGYILINKFKIMNNIISLCVWTTFLAFLIDIVIPNFIGFILPETVFSIFLLNGFNNGIYILGMGIINIILYFYIKRKDYLYLSY